MDSDSIYDVIEDENRDYYCQYSINHESLEQIITAYRESSIKSQFFMIEYSIRTMKKDFVRWLLKNEAKNQSFNTDFLMIESIFLGIRTGEVDIIDDLLKISRFGPEFIHNQMHIQKLSYDFCFDVEEISNIPSVEQMLSVIKLLYQNGINFNIKSVYDYETALQIAVKYKKLEVIQYLLEKGADPNARSKVDRNTALHYACTNVFQNDQSESIVQILMYYGSNMYLENLEGLTPLCVAINSNAVKCVKEFLKLGYFINYKNKSEYQKGKTALFYACENLNTEIVKLLLENNARVDIYDCNDLNPLHIVASKPKFNQFQGNKIAKYLLNNCNDLDVNRMGTFDFIVSTALHLACKNQNINLAKILINYNADVNIKNSKGDTPLLISIQCCESKVTQIEFFNIFIKEGSSIYEKNHESLTLFHFACQKGNLEIVEYFLKRGIRINNNDDENNNKFNSPLYLAASASNENFDEKLIYLLLFCGANLNLKFIFSQKNINNKAIKTILKYLLLLNKQGKISDDYRFEVIKSIDVNYKNICEKELEEMETTFLCNDYSMFSFFIKSIHLQAKWLLVNNNRKQTVRTLCLKEQFPEYWKMFEIKAKTAVERTAYLDLAIISVNNLLTSSLGGTKMLDVPNIPEIIMKIVSYLSLMDLKNLSSV